MRSKRQVSHGGLIAFGLCSIGVLPLFTSAFLTLLLAGTAGAAEMWRQSFEKDIKWYHTTHSGEVIVGTQASVVGLNSENGQILWKIENLEKTPAQNFKLLPMTIWALAALKEKGAQEATPGLLNFHTGEFLWKADAIGVSKIRTAYTVFHPDGDRLLMIGETKDGKKSRRMLMVDGTSGHVLWTASEKTESLVHPPLQLSSDTIVLLCNDEILRMYSAGDGTMAWETTLPTPGGRGNPSPWGGLAPPIHDPERGLVWTAYHHTISAVRLADGSAIWSEAPKLPGPVNQMILTSAGVVVKTLGTDDEVQSFASALVDYESGQVLWKKTYGGGIKEKASKSQTTSTPFISDGRRVIFVKSGGDLIAHDLATGEQSKLTRLEFEDDTPRAIEVRDGLWTICGAQTIIHTDTMGTLQSRHFFEPPGGSLGLGLVLLAISVAADAGAMDWSVGNNVTVGVGSNYWGAYSELAKVFTATREAQDYLCLMTEVTDGSESGPGLVKVRKSDGHREVELRLGTKQPDYRLDEIGKRLLVKTEDKTLVCYPF